MPQYTFDGLPITAAEPWFESKARILYEYIKVFSANAICKADEVIFIDLHAGSGLYTAGPRKEVFAGACLRALDDALPIAKWIFYEKDPALAHALQQRVRQFFPKKNVIVPQVNPHELVDTLRSLTTPASRESKTAVLCLADPFSLDMSFTLIRSLASLHFNFLVPFTLMLNERNDHSFYMREQGDRLKKYLGTPALDSLKNVTGNLGLYRKLVQAYQNNMLVTGLNAALSVHKLESGLMQLPAYYIGFFSRAFSANAIRQEVKASDHLQFELF